MQHSALFVLLPMLLWLFVVFIIASAYAVSRMLTRRQLLARWVDTFSPNLKLELNSYPSQSKETTMVQVPELVEPGMMKYNVTTEQWREYDYFDKEGNKLTYRIEFPLTLWIKPKPGRTGSHRVLDNNGIVHYIPEDWKFLRWAPKDNTDPVEW